jgi:hypothetical protein
MDLDSRDLLNFVIALHEASGVGIPEKDYPQLASLNGCVQYLKGRLEKGWPRTRDPAKGQCWAAALTWVNAPRRAGGLARGEMSAPEAACMSRPASAVRAEHTYPTILKVPRELRLCPNLADYDRTCHHFTWDSARLMLEGLPGGEGPQYRA